MPAPISSFFRKIANVFEWAEGIEQRVDDIEEHLEHCCPTQHPAASIRFTITAGQFTFTGDNMQTSLQVGFQESILGNPLTDVLGPDGVTPLPSNATLSNQVYTSSDETVFKVFPDSTVPGGAVIVAVPPATGVDPTLPRSATMTETALATEPAGSTTAPHQIQGVLTVTITAGPPPPPPPAASIGFTIGTPVKIPDVPPPPTV